MRTLDQALSQTIETMLYAKTGQVQVLTPADIPDLISRVTVGMKNLGVLTTKVEVKLVDEGEFVAITVYNSFGKKGDKKANYSIDWKDAQGNYLVRIDTDGDGK